MAEIIIKAKKTVYILTSCKEQNFIETNDIYIGKLMNNKKCKNIYTGIIEFNITGIDFEEADFINLNLFVKSYRNDRKSDMIIIISKLSGEYDLSTINYKTEFKKEKNMSFMTKACLNCNEKYFVCNVIDLFQSCNECDFDINKKRTCFFMLEIIESSCDNILINIDGYKGRHPPFLEINNGLCKIDEEYNYEQLYKKYYGDSECKFYLEYYPYK